MYDRDTHHRQSIRLDGFDYKQAGTYFVTVCIQERAKLLGRIQDGELEENDAGRMVRTAWEQLPEQYPGVTIDAFVVMPNHIHGIIILEKAPDYAARLSLPDVMQRLKSWTTALYRTGVNQQGWTPFPGRLWQRNYYERIIRDEREWQALREYIILNPSRWDDDEEHVPEGQAPVPALFFPCLPSLIVPALLDVRFLTAPIPV